MKKKCPLFLIPVLLAAVIAGVIWHVRTNALTFREIEPDGFSAVCPVQARARVNAHRGQGLSPSGAAIDDGSDEAAWRAVQNALESTKYIPLPSWLKPKEDGIVVEAGSGCMGSEPIYWAGGILWVAADQDTWTPYLPLDAEGLDFKMRRLVDDYGYRLGQGRPVIIPYK